MRQWEGASLAFFVYLACAAIVPGRSGAARLKLATGAAAGFLFIAITATAPDWPLLHEWVGPPIALLLAYWTSGSLFVAPRPLQEATLLALDRRLRVLDRARAMPRPLALALEAAYAGVYPTIPVALALHLLFVPQPDPEHFWEVVLVTDYICFGFLAWVQTRPPRALEEGEPWQSAARRFNVRLLGATSIQVNTFPSGHAAEALAATLLLLGAPWPIAAGMFLNALAISAGTVFGRYHYAADAIAGWAVAIVVWLAIG
jgi:membrane-associated phospholipid phosphatase